MRGGRNKFGPMYKRDRALKQQAIRQQQQMMASCQMRLAQGLDMYPNHTAGGEAPDVKPDPAFLMSVANSLGYGMNDSANSMNLSLVGPQHLNSASMGGSPNDSNIPSPTVSEPSPRDMRVNLNNLSSSSSATGLTHAAHNGHNNGHSPPGSGNQGVISYNSNTNNNSGYYSAVAQNSSLVSPNSPSGDNRMFQPYNPYTPVHPSTPDNLPMLPMLIVDLKSSALDEREMKGKLLSFVDSEFKPETVSVQDFPGKLLSLLCRLCDQLSFLMVEWARTSVFFRELKVRPKKNILSFGQLDPTYQNRPTLDFFYENAVFFRWGLYYCGFNS